MLNNVCILKQHMHSWTHSNTHIDTQTNLTTHTHTHTRVHTRTYIHPHSHTHTHSLSLFLSLSGTFTGTYPNRVGRVFEREKIDMSMTLIWYTEEWNKLFNHELTRVHLLHLCWVFTHFVTVILWLYTVSHDVCHTLNSNTKQWCWIQHVIFTCFPVSVWRNAYFSRLCFPPPKTKLNQKFVPQNGPW